MGEARYGADEREVQITQSPSPQGLSFNILDLPAKVLYPIDMRTAILNEQFGVGEEFLLEEPGDAFPSTNFSMPQFSDILDAALHQDTLKPSSIREEDLNSPLPVTNRWHPQLVMDLALGLDDQATILHRHSLTEYELEKLYLVPSFRREIMVMTREMHEQGVTFARKSALQAESYLSTIDLLMMNPATAAATRLDIFKTLTKYGNLEPKEEKSDQNTGPQINVQINF